MRHTAIVHQTETLLNTGPEHTHHVINTTTVEILRGPVTKCDNKTAMACRPNAEPSLASNTHAPT